MVVGGVVTIRGALTLGGTRLRYVSGYGVARFGLACPGRLCDGGEVCGDDQHVERGW